MKNLHVSSFFFVAFNNFMNSIYNTQVLNLITPELGNDNHHSAKKSML